MKIALLSMQILILVAQVACLVYCKKKNKDIVDFAGGFGFWGIIPSITLMAVINSIN